MYQTDSKLHLTTGNTQASGEGRPPSEPNCYFSRVRQSERSRNTADEWETTCLGKTNGWKRKSLEETNGRERKRLEETNGWERKSLEGTNGWEIKRLEERGVWEWNSFEETNG